LDDALRAIVQRVEASNPGSLCTILIAEGNQLRTGAAPSLPASFNAAVDGLPIAEGSAVCGTAAARRAPVVVSDLSTDPLTANYRQLAADHGLKSSWSTPVLGPDGDVMATFALYRRDALPPTAAAEADVARAARLVRIVLQRERAAERLVASEALFRVASLVAQVGGFSVEIPSRKVTWSDEVARIHGKAAGHHPTLDEGISYYVPEARPVIRELFERCATDGVPWDTEMEIVASGGRRVWVRVIGQAIRDTHGRITRVQGALQDITERKLAEFERRRLADRLQETLENISDGVMMLDSAWRITFVNAEAARLVRRARADLEGRSFWLCFPEAVGSEFERVYRRAHQSGKPAHVEAFYGPLDGWFEVNVYPYAQGLALYFRNVTERRAASARIAEQAALLDKARDAILVRKLDHTIIYWNRSAERLYGWTAEQAIGRSTRELMNGGSPEFDEAFRELMERGEWTGILRQVTREGSRIIVECRWTLVRDDAGTPTSVLAINTDITERRNLEQQFLRAQRLESIGTLAGGIAHDLNNVLSPIMMSLDLLGDQVTGDGRALVEDLRHNVRRGADLIRQVLTFARGLDGKREPVDLVQLTREIEKVVRETFPKNIALRGLDADAGGVVNGDATQLHQVLLNLCVNARDAMPAGGTLALGIATREIADATEAQALGVEPGVFVSLEVADTGSGIPPHLQDVIFEPFYTTKEVGHGTGLGLSTVLSIVRSHGGAVQLHSELGRGATFVVLLPAVAGRRVAASPPDGTRHVHRGNDALVLVVDDEALIRAVAKRILERHGYRVLLAEHGGEAVELVRTSAERVQAVICDVSMPVMDGPATVAALRKLRPTLPIIVSSGYVGDEGASKLLGTGVEHFISKPFTSETLLTALHSVIGVR
jgi:two-component system cell cycle sensor histidine kinase/response regulator CckA